MGVLPLGTTGRFYTLSIYAHDAGLIEVDATAEGLGDLVGAVLEQLDNATFAEMLTNQVGHRNAAELGQALLEVAEARAKEAATRVTER